MPTTATTNPFCHSFHQVQVSTPDPRMCALCIIKKKEGVGMLVMDYNS